MTPEQEEETLIRIMRRRVLEANDRITEIQKKIDSLKDKEREYRTEQNEVRTSIKETVQMLKVLTPVKTSDEINAEIKQTIMEALQTAYEETPDDCEFAISRLMIEKMSHLNEEYIGRGIEGRVRAQMRELVEEGKVLFRKITTTSNRQANLYSYNPGES